MNRLADQISPYLLQHADNPVDWYAWGDEAFEEARRRDVPIFLSVGYSSCHWCHVMTPELVQKATRSAFVGFCAHLGVHGSSSHTLPTWEEAARTLRSLRPVES